MAGRFEDRNASRRDVLPMFGDRNQSWRGVIAVIVSLGAMLVGANAAAAGPYARGNAPPTGLSAGVVGIAATPTGDGYWRVTAGGDILVAGRARSYGSAARLHLAHPIVGIAATPSGHGYWLVASDGGVFTFGNAKFYG